MYPKVFIIILNWNGAEDTIACLDSLKAIDYPNFEIIFVDNHSGGDDVEVVEKIHKDFLRVTIRTDKNLGFSGGNNIGIEYALNNSAEYIMLLNNDTIVESNFLSELIKDIDNDENVGIFTPLINYNSKRDTVWCAGGFISKIRASGFPYGINKNEDGFKTDRFCTFASGCCMLIKREVFEKVGLLDENYFLYLEDTDFCARTVKAGYKIKFVGSSKIFHKVFSTTGKVNSLMPLYYSVRNRLFFVRKNFRNLYYISFIYITFVFFVKTIINRKLGLRGLHLIISAYKDFFQNNMGKSTQFDSKVI